MRALVLALNPSIDVEWRLDQVRWEEKNEVQSQRRWAGGKGVNVTRWLQHLGGKPQLLLPLGGPAGAELATDLRAENIPATVIRLHEPTRANVIVTTKAGRQMRFNPLGPNLSRTEWNAILKSVERHLRSRRRQSAQIVLGKRQSRLTSVATVQASGLLILSGSLPRGVPITAYAKLIQIARRVGVKTLLDCDGPAFAAAVKARPFLVKPNEHELAQWWGQPLRSEAQLIRAARALSEQTRGWVFVSRGARRSLLVNRIANFQSLAMPPRLKPRNTVGAGDALLAAVARQIQIGAAPSDWLQAGVAVGSAATQCAAGELPG